MVHTDAAKLPVFAIQEKSILCRKLYPAESKVRIISIGKRPLWAQVAAAFVGSLLAMLYVLIFANKVKSMSMLLVVGIMISYISVTRKAIEDAENGIGMSRSFSSVKDLMEDLNADD